MHRRIAKRVSSGLVVTGATLLLASTGAVLASGNSLKVDTPKNAKIHVTYKLTAHGFATGNDTLDVFIDYLACGSTPTVENSHGAPGIGYSVKGKFSKVSHWTSNIKGTDHVCAYLFGSHGIVKRVFKTYKIH